MTTDPALPTGGPPARPVGRTQGPLTVWLLTLVTFGIYFFVWYYRIHAELRAYEPRTGAAPGSSLLAVTLGSLLCGIPPIVSVFRCGQRISVARAVAGRPADCSGIVFLLLNLVFGLGVVYYQAKLNEVWVAAARP